MHDGNGGVRDDLTTSAELTAWAHAQAAALSELAGVDGVTADEHLHAEVLGVRTAVRALFARMVSPAPPSRADAGRLPSAQDALAHLNRVAGRAPVRVTLDWPADGAPRVQMVSTGEHLGAAERLTSALARDAIAFLAGPDSQRLAACSAPRCVRYFLKEHGRQEYCKPSCSNRARAARHYQLHHDGTAQRP